MAQGDAELPAISRRIRETRERLQKQWERDHPGKRGNPFTQANVAARVGATGITAKAYGDFERGKTEPSLLRLRETALALGLDEDYFMPTGDLVTTTARLEAEADRLHETVDVLAGLLEPLRALLPAEPPAQAPDEPG
jgi:transcriptional regulator with XRE-family HTH domain